MTLSKPFSSVEGINPNLHLVLVKLVWEFVVVEVRLRCSHSIDLFELLQVESVAVLLLVVVVDEHLLTDRVLVQLVGLDIRLLLENLTVQLILLTNNVGSRIKLLEIIHNRILNINVCLREHIIDAFEMIRRVNWLPFECAKLVERRTLFMILSTPANISIVV